MQIIEKQITKTRSFLPKPAPKSYGKFVFMALFGILLVILVGMIVYDHEGNPDIPPDRKQKLDTALKKLDNAEQYALLAQRNGMYVCPSCKNRDSIFLFVGEVWKYGVSTNGLKRYSAKFLDSNNLRYFMQINANLLESQNQV